jgi:nitrous oxide reductase
MADRSGHSTTKGSRRAFFKTMALFGGAVALTPFAGAASETGKTPAADAKENPTGYHITPHIRRYYERAEE